MLRFDLETEMPQLVGPSFIRDSFGGLEKVRFVEVLEVRRCAALCCEALWRVGTACGVLGAAGLRQGCRLGAEP